ncbi:MAG: DUF3499 family protein [Acidimicrobiia bacterium]
MMVACIRCSNRATSVLTYDHAAAEAYLDDARGDEERHEGMTLCASHTQRFTAPQGWLLLDRRADDLRLFAGGD